ncbi:TonB-linked outer membrane protein, SusC/RagA family [Lutibacter agarilyticus]|uniref:TonB-linked outer membrane protein, SusC/RagA family n=1 Tax=Lutibacter agarilyticus TaxID=1109740 RepID=A0A238VAZ8_9FLAO|nr:TonB-dependent receptor [Lutibacter agarilyticus]SNR31371.1 TonB-linked outer membrane protein, SusC/RagA family [Lutibacter agarilyticus]
MKKEQLTLLGRRSMLLLLFVIFAIPQIYGQNITVKGTVKDEQNLPLPGANVLVKGTNTGELTGFDGDFTIVTDSNATLLISFIGYKSQEVAINGKTVIDVILTEDANALDEVVIVGYGSQAKSDLTGSVGVVNSKEIDKLTYSDPAQALQGRIAGVNVTTGGGAPGAKSIVTIRGSGTLSDAGPLYVIDGMLTGSMSSINPGDIASVSVLKDASASAIYGSRAANGVIIITTKKGKKGEVKIDFDSSYGWQKAVNVIDYATAEEYAAISNRARDNDGVARVPANDSEFNPNYTSDIQNESLRTAPVQNYNIRFYGGGENGTYSVSLNHYDQDGIVKESDYQRTTARFNVGLEKGIFKLESSVGLTRTVDNYNNYFNQERDLIPTIRTKDDDDNWSANDHDGAFGAFYGVGSAINSLGLASIEDRTVKRNTVIGNIGASLKIVKGLTYKLNLGIESYADNNFKFTPEYFFNEASLGNTIFAELNERNTNYLSTLVENTLSYKGDWDKHSLDAIVGYTEQLSNTRYLGAKARTFPSNDIKVASAAQDRVEMPSQDLTKGIQSYFGRVSYSYDERYLFTATVRRDGSSLFKEDLRWGTFPSVAIGWNLSNEKFMLNFKALSDIKFRASYGEVGSDNVGIYAIYPELNLNSEAVIGNPQIRVPGYSITKGVNSNITWETTKTTDIGIDFTALNNRLNVTLDYFIKDSEDVLVSLRPPLYTGFDNDVPFNSASVSNKGFEFLAGYNDQFGEVSFNASANFTILNNEVTALGNATPIIAGGFTSNGLLGTKTDVGQPISSFFGYVTDGIYQTDEEAIAANDSFNPHAGDIRFKDLDNDGDVDTDDQTYLGNPTPNFMYGFNVSAEYKGFDLSLFFNGVSGNKILNGVRYRGYFDTEGNYLADALNAWTPENTSSNIPKNTLSDTGYNRRMSNFYLENGAYFRLRNAQLGYSLPSDIMEKIKISKIRIYASASNVFTITNYTGYYPEVGRNSRGNSTQIFSSGVDEGSYPVPRTIQLGVQVSF